MRARPSPPRDAARGGPRRIALKRAPTSLKPLDGVRLFDDLEAVFFYYWVGQDFFGDALQVLFGFLAIPAVEIQDEELALADVFYGLVA
jgi:hypothetical protein